jgi:secreted PhoX family phosphatase
MSPIVRSTRTIPCMEQLASISRRTFLGGSLAGSNPSFTADAAAAKASIAKLAGLRFETLLVGHGEPILAGASAQVAVLAAPD